MDAPIMEQINLVNRALSNIVAAYGLWARKNGLHYNALMVLYEMEGRERCTQKQLCDALLLPKSTVHSILMEFVKKGYMTLEGGQANKKEKLVRYTQEGEAFAAGLLGRLHRLESHAMEQLGPRLRVLLVEANTAFYELFNREVEQDYE